MDERRQDHRPIAEIDDSHRHKDATPGPDKLHSGKAVATPIELHAVVSDPFPDLQSALDQAAHMARRVKSVTAEQQRKIKDLESDLDIQKKANSTLLADNHTLTKELAQLQEAFEQLRKEHEASQSCVRSLIKERDLMQEDLGEARSMAHKARSDNHQLQRELMETQQLNENLRHESTRAKQKMAHTADTINAFKEIINQLEESSTPPEEPISLETPSSDTFESWLGQKIEKEKQSA